MIRRVVVSLGLLALIYLGTTAQIFSGFTRQLPDGTASAPALSFLSATTTGLHREPSDASLRLGVAGNARILIRTNEVVFNGADIRVIGTTFASLPASTNGTLTFCPDCTIANPCAGGGTGAFAKRLNGVWVCN